MKLCRERTGMGLSSQSLLDAVTIGSEKEVMNLRSLWGFVSLATTCRDRSYDRLGRAHQLTSAARFADPRKPKRKNQIDIVPRRLLDTGLINALRFRAPLERLFMEAAKLLLHRSDPVAIEQARCS